MNKQQFLKQLEAASSPWSAYGLEALGIFVDSAYLPSYPEYRKAALDYFGRCHLASLYALHIRPRLQPERDRLLASICQQAAATLNNERLVSALEQGRRIIDTLPEI